MSELAVNHYDTLEVSPRASQEVIRAAYRSLMQRFHPDRNPGDQAAATRAADVATAYEVLSDPPKRASYDAGLQMAGRPEMPQTPVTRRGGGVAAPRAHQVRAAAAAGGAGRLAGSRRWFKLGLWFLGALATMAGIYLSQSLMTRVDATRVDPATELDAIRLTMSSDSTPEAEKRRLYARKLAILDEHPELLRRASAQQSEDMAARTFPLLASPLVVRVSQPPSRPGPLLELTVPAASLLVGSFDAQNLLAHMAGHRERLVQDLAARLAQQRADRLSGPDAEDHLKRVVAESVTASLELPAPGEYPSTYFASPGTYGVVAVLLPDRFTLVQLESGP